MIKSTLYELYQGPGFGGKINLEIDEILRFSLEHFLIQIIVPSIATLPNILYHNILNSFSAKNISVTDFYPQNTSHKNSQSLSNSINNPAN